MAPPRTSRQCPEHSGLSARLDGVGDRLARIEEKLDALVDERLPKLSAEVASLKTRAGLLGLLAGAVGAALAKIGIGRL